MDGESHQGARIGKVEGFIVGFIGDLKRDRRGGQHDARHHQGRTRSRAAGPAYDDIEVVVAIIEGDASAGESPIVERGGGDTQVCTSRRSGLGPGTTVGNCQGVGQRNRRPGIAVVSAFDRIGRCRQRCACLLYTSPSPRDTR